MHDERAASGAASGVALRDGPREWQMGLVVRGRGGRYVGERRSRLVVASRLCRLMLVWPSRAVRGSGAIRGTCRFIWLMLPCVEVLLRMPKTPLTDLYGFLLRPG
jgi:hypothetical protein